MRFPIAILILLLIQPKMDQENIIVWDVNKKLSWEDFQGEPNPDSDAAAITASGISFQLTSKIKGGETIYDCTVFAYFAPEKSWYNPRVVNDNILGHEQLHFDITALFAEKLKDRLKNITASDNTEEVGEHMMATYKAILAELDSVQRLYDTQTDYSINESSQLIWQEKIDRELRK